MRDFSSSATNSVVYIVDDDSALLEGMEIVLEQHDYIPVGFSKPTAFWKKLKKQKPAAVVLDIGLPGEKGDQIAKKLKASEEYKDVPVIMISAAQGLEQKAMQVEADWYLNKPFSLEKLLHVLDASVSSRNE